MDMDRREMLKRTSLATLGMTGLGIANCGCRTAPMTGRRQLMLVPEGKEITLGATAFEETVGSQPLSTNQHASEMLNRVGNRIAAVSGRSDYKWEFKLLASAEQNAFCLPGGKVAFYEGILPVCEDEAGLAVVMSHEVAHALARHGGERMSQNMGVEGAKMMVDRIAKSRLPDHSGKILQAYGVASKYGVLLPYSRRQESEADHIGIMLMSEAGYDPTVAPAFWQRFGNLKSGEKQPEFLSTHPADARRAQDLMALMDKASQIYSTAKTKYGSGERLI
jgi:predicted Zn-dependent protease